MHDVLFAHQGKLGVVPWADLAVSAGVPDLPAFEQCLVDPKISAKVTSDAEVAKALKSRGTPTVVLLGGTRFVGVPAKARLDSMISAVATNVAKTPTR